MRKLVSCIVLVLTIPASATIAQQRAASKWTCSGTVTGGTLTCSQSFTTTGANDLIAVWTTWQSSVTLTASVSDSLPGTQYKSAVGPTQQPTQASGTPTNAQIFYLPSTGNVGGADTVTVTLTGPASTSVPSFGMVMAEYSGLDTVAPLDSVSEAISNSTSPSGTLDSGTAAPANANLLVFGGGNTDYIAGVPSAETGFTTVQSTLGNITEQMIVSTNVALQRAQASSGSGNWVMQMAVFRAASWTVSSGWSTTRANNIRYADQFPGGDCGAKVNAADADLAANAGEIWVSNACGTAITTPVTINANHVLRFVQGGTYTYCGEWTLNGNAVSIVGPPTGITEDVNNHPLPAVILQQACTLSVSFLLKGANITITGVGILGNNSGAAGSGVGILTDTSVSTTNSRGRIILADMTIGNFSGDNIQVTSTGGNDQAEHFEIDYVSSNRAIGGNCITVTNTNDVYIHRFFGEVCGGWGLKVVNSAVNIEGSDLSMDNSGGIMVTGILGSPGSVKVINTAIASPSCVSCTETGNAAILVNGWDGSHCNVAKAQIINANIAAGTGMEGSTLDAIYISDSFGNLVQGEYIAGAGFKRGYYHVAPNCSASESADTLVAPQFSGSFSTAAFGTLPPDVFAQLGSLKGIFSSLTSCSSSIEGQTAPVTDSTVSTWGDTVCSSGCNGSGGGLDHVLLYCDGTNWTVAAK
jgi:hypothetical protein